MTGLDWKVAVVGDVSGGGPETCGQNSRVLQGFFGFVDSFLGSLGEASGHPLCFYLRLTGLLWFSRRVDGARRNQEPRHEDQVELH